MWSQNAKGVREDKAEKKHKYLPNLNRWTEKTLIHIQYIIHVKIAATRWNLQETFHLWHGYQALTAFFGELKFQKYIHIFSIFQMGWNVKIIYNVYIFCSKSLEVKPMFSININYIFLAIILKFARKYMYNVSNWRINNIYTACKYEIVKDKFVPGKYQQH